MPFTWHISKIGFNDLTEDVEEILAEKAVELTNKDLEERAIPGSDLSFGFPGASRGQEPYPHSALPHNTSCSFIKIRVLANVNL